MAGIKSLTIGIEEEYQIIDPESRELTSFISKFLEQGTLLFRDQMTPELLQSQVEISSKVCKNIQEAREEIQKLRRMISDFAEKNNRRILAAAPILFLSGKTKLLRIRNGTWVWLILCSTLPGVC